MSYFPIYIVFNALMSVYHQGYVVCNLFFLIFFIFYCVFHIHRYTFFCACDATFSYWMACIWLSRFCRSSLSNESAASFCSIACQWSSVILFVSCCEIWGSMTLQQCFLNPSALACWLPKTNSLMPSSLI